MMSLAVSHALAIAALAMLFVNGAGARTVGNSSAAPNNETTRTVKVAGSGFDDLQNAIFIGRSRQQQERSSRARRPLSSMAT